MPPCPSIACTCYARYHKKRTKISKRKSIFPSLLRKNAFSFAFRLRLDDPSARRLPQTIHDGVE